MRLLLRLSAIVIALVMATVLFLKYGPWSADVALADDESAAEVASAADGGTAVGESPAEPSTAGPAAPGAAPAGPLPPLDAPLSEVGPELERRAAAGEVGAACRLAAELSNCRWSRGDDESHVRWLRRQNEELDRLGNQGDVAAISAFKARFDGELAQRELMLARRKARCEGYTDVSASTMAQHWYQAARLGSPSARRVWAGGEALPPDGYLDATAELALYRATGGDMAWQLVREGDLAMTLRVAHALSGVQRNRYSLLGQALPEDPAMAIALYRRVLAALEASDRQPAEGLRRQIRAELEVVEDLAGAEARAEAARRALDAEGWSPVRADAPVLPAMASGHGTPVGPHLCHQEAGEEVPELENLRRIRR